MTNTANKKICIVADTKETNSGILQTLNTDPEVSLEIRELPVGDYLLSESCVVERKTAADFLASIIDRRLFLQVAHMKTSFEQSVVLVEGDLFSARSQMNPCALCGALSWLSVIEHVCVVPSGTVENSVCLLKAMSRHLAEGLGYEIPLRGHKGKQPDIISQFLVEGLPGIGPSAAKNLLATFGSAAAIFQAPVSELIKTQGIGVKKAEEIRKALDHPYSRQ